MTQAAHHELVDLKLLVDALILNAGGRQTIYPARPEQEAAARLEQRGLFSPNAGGYLPSPRATALVPDLLATLDRSDVVDRADVE